MTDFAKLILDADTKGLKQGEKALKDLGAQAKETADKVDMGASQMEQANKNLAQKGITPLTAAADTARASVDNMTQSTVQSSAVLNQMGQSAQSPIASLGGVAAQSRRTATELGVMNQSLSAAQVGVVGFMSAAQRVPPQLQQVGASAGAARQGMLQLGYQVGDMAAMFSLGANATQIFASQLGQVIGAVQLMSGGTSKFAAFLGGPWGIALSAGAIVMAPFIGKLWDTYGAANAATGALEGLIQKQRQQQAQAREGINAEKDLNALIRRRGELEAEIQKRGVRNPATGQLQFVFRQQQELAEVNKRIGEGRSAMDASRVSALGLDSIMGKLGTTSTATGTALSSGVGGGARSAATSFKPLRDELQGALAELESLKRGMRDNGLFSSMAERGDITRQIRADDAPPEQDMGRLNKGLTDLQDRMNGLKDKARETTSDVRDSFRTMATDALSALDRLAGGIQSGNFLSILSGVLNFGLQLGGMGVFGKSVQANIQPRANGGNVSAGQPYLVGENRPEMFVPDTNGRIMPQVPSGATRVVVEASPYFDVRVDGRIQTAAPVIADAGANVAQSRMNRTATRRVA